MVKQPKHWQQVSLSLSEPNVLGIDQFIRTSLHPLGFCSAEARDVIEDGGQAPNVPHL